MLAAVVAGFAATGGARLQNNKSFFPAEILKKDSPFPFLATALLGMYTLSNFVLAVEGQGGEVADWW